LPRGLNLFDPVKEVSGLLSPPLAYNSYQHNGLPSFLLGVVDPIRFQKYLSTPVKHPPHVTSGPFTASLSDQLDVLVRTLRDAEIIALGHIPSANVVARYDVW